MYQHKTNPLIEMETVSKHYHTPAGNFIALDAISTDFFRGEFVSIVGKSGSGKSTLLNMLTGIDRPTGGTVWVDGQDIHAFNESQMADWRGKNLGIVFQFYQLLPMLSLLENVMVPMDFCNMYAPNERESRAMDLLDMVGLAEFADKMPSNVSGGQQQSAAIARALANNPPMLIADEPTGNLDTQSAEVIFGIFDELASQGKTIIMVTHDDSLAERANRLVRLVDGHIHEILQLRQPARQPVIVPEPVRQYAPGLSLAWALGDD